MGQSPTLDRSRLTPEDTLKMRQILRYKRGQDSSRESSPNKTVPQDTTLVSGPLLKDSVNREVNKTMKFLRDFLIMQSSPKLNDVNLTTNSLLAINSILLYSADSSQTTSSQKNIGTVISKSPQIESTTKSRIKRIITDTQQNTIFAKDLIKGVDQNDSKKFSFGSQQPNEKPNVSPQTDQSLMSSKHLKSSGTTEFEKSKKENSYNSRLSPPATQKGSSRNLSPEEKNIRTTSAEKEIRIDRYDVIRREKKEKDNKTHDSLLHLREDIDKIKEALERSKSADKEKKKPHNDNPYVERLSNPTTSSPYQEITKPNTQIKNFEPKMTSNKMVEKNNLVSPNFVSQNLTLSKHITSKGKIQKPDIMVASSFQKYNSENIKQTRIGYSPPRLVERRNNEQMGNQDNRWRNIKSQSPPPNNSTKEPAAFFTNGQTQNMYNDNYNSQPPRFYQQPVISTSYVPQARGSGVGSSQPIGIKNNIQTNHMNRHNTIIPEGKTLYYDQKTNNYPQYPHEHYPANIKQEQQKLSQPKTVYNNNNAQQFFNLNQDIEDSIQPMSINVNLQDLIHDSNNYFTPNQDNVHFPHYQKLLNTKDNTKYSPPRVKDGNIASARNIEEDKKYWSQNIPYSFQNQNQVEGQLNYRVKTEGNSSPERMRQSPNRSKVYEAIASQRMNKYEAQPIKNPIFDKNTRDPPKDLLHISENAIIDSIDLTSNAKQNKNRDKPVRKSKWELRNEAGYTSEPKGQALYNNNKKVATGNQIPQRSKKVAL